MKTPLQNKIIIVALLIVTLITLSGLYFFGTKINSTGEEVQKLNRIFPDKLGAYRLIDGDEGFREAECEIIKPNQEIKDLTLLGQICERSMGAEYKDNSSGHVVFIHFIRITEGVDTYRKLLDRVSRAERLEPYPVIRLEGSEIGWFPVVKDFDIIISQEGDITPTGFDYSIKADGKNAVTEYFLYTYPPVTN